MSSQSFRFLHASDLHLEQPLGGQAEVPGHLRDLFLDAPFTAAERVFDATVRERVDFLVLSGDVLSPTLAGPRGISFLLNQFDRLNTHGIAVYWAGGKCDGPQDWPNAAKLPDNVQVFPSYKSEEVSHFRGEKPLASIIGRSWHGAAAISGTDYGVDSGNLFTLAIGHGQGDYARLVQRGIDFWALGGRHERETLGNPHDGIGDEWQGIGTVHYPGSPQGRTLDETGPHGCTLVHVADDRTVRTQFIPTDAVRWQNEGLTVELEETRADVKRRIGERMKELLIEAVERPLLVRWEIAGGNRIASLARRREWGAELLEWLRTEYGQGRAPVWTLDLEMQHDKIAAAEWYEEESMLGDFLRVIRAQDSADAVPLDLMEYLPERQRTTRLAAITDWTDNETRGSLLREAALLGAQLLGAEERI